MSNNGAGDEEHERATEALRLLVEQRRRAAQVGGRGLGRKLLATRVGKRLGWNEAEVRSLEVRLINLGNGRPCAFTRAELQAVAAALTTRSPKDAADLAARMWELELSRGRDRERVRELRTENERIRTETPLNEPVAALVDALEKLGRATDVALGGPDALGVSATENLVSAVARVVDRLASRDVRYFGYDEAPVRLLLDAIDVLTWLATADAELVGAVQVLAAYKTGCVAARRAGWDDEVVRDPSFDEMRAAGVLPPRSAARPRLAESAPGLIAAARKAQNTNTDGGSDGAEG